MYHSKIERLKDRAAMLTATRSFFAKNAVLEVDCPILSPRASVDAHIDLISACYRGQDKVFMHSSPEFGMKRLLSEGIGDIYQLSHVFRDGEWGSKHNPEFTMIEWYRLNFSLDQMIEETAQLIQLFLGILPSKLVSYRDLFMQKTGIDYVKANEQDLYDYIQAHKIPSYPNVLEEGKDALLNLILNSIEPELGQEALCILAYYPASQAALARKRWHGDEQVAERFEIYYQGMELANGYHELTDHMEQQQRFHEANALRIALGKEPLPIDHHFLQALEKGLPDCSGVAVGFDRLMMIRQQQKDISQVITWGWELA